MAVYGPAQDEFKYAFLKELVRACQHNPLPTLIGGDFNIMRSSKEKNKDRFSNRWLFLFNIVIDSFDLREINLTGRQFTWANSYRFWLARSVSACSLGLEYPIDGHRDKA